MKGVVKGRGESRHFRYGKCRLIVLLGATGTAVDKEFHCFFHDRWMDEMEAVEFEEFNVVAFFFQFIVVMKSTGFHRELFVLGTMGDEYERLASGDIQVHEAAGEGNDMGNDFAVGQADGKRVACTVRKTAEAEMVFVDGVAGCDFFKALVQFFQIGAVAANGQIPGDVGGLGNHQEKFFFFSPVLEKWHDFFSAAACTVKHDEQFDGLAGFQSFGNNQYGVSFPFNAQ